MGGIGAAESPVLGRLAATGVQLAGPQQDRMACLVGHRRRILSGPIGAHQARRQGAAQSRDTRLHDDRACEGWCRI
jgi:hypothetical protein